MQNKLENKSIKMARNLITKPTQYDASLQKLFYITIASASINYDLPLKPPNAIAVKKEDVFRLINVQCKDKYTRYRAMFDKLSKDSFFSFGDNENYTSGHIFPKIKGQKHYWYVFVDEEYLPIIQDISSNYVQLLLDDVITFQSKFSMMIYQNLLSLYNLQSNESNETIRTADYTTKQLKELLGLSKNDYTRKDGSFARTVFENKCIIRAVEEINEKSKLINHLTWTKEYIGKRVNKYVFTYQVDDIDRYKYGEKSYQKLLQCPKTK